MKNSGIRLLVILLLYLFSCAQQEGGGNLSNQEEITAIENLFAKVMEASRKGDFEMYLSLYTDDAVWMLKDRLTDAGKAEIRPVYKFMEEYSFDQELTINEIKVVEDWAYARITADGWLVPKPGIEGERQRAVSRHIMILRRQPDGVWKFTRDIYINPITKNS